MSCSCLELVDPKEVKLDAVLSAYQGKKGVLVPVLQEAQEIYGYLSQEVMEKISRTLRILPAEVYGVATFYSQFRLKPMGKHIIQICLGTACHVRGGAKVLEAIEEKLRIKDGETTSDGRFSLEIVACIGACGLAPVVSIDGDVHGRLIPERVGQILENYV
ncbi:MAG: NADH dehydrogenase [Gracilibacter sp. BRH_c7a]|nr:MAG: NADH dehydrogenase [Gracilibacter sp. BRH_c7a]